MPPLAILDLGTNTFHLLIADISQGAPCVLFQETIAVKLGEGGIKKGCISGAAFDRGISALKRFKRSIDQYHVTHVRAVATSALRTASNGEEFLTKVRSETGIEPEIIAGDREAELIYQGVRGAINLAGEKCLIMDIGGGSVEFIICNGEQVFWKKSYDIGAARLMEQFHHSDPISETDKKSLYGHLSTVLIGLKQELKKHDPALLIGSAGAFETFAELIEPEFQVDFNKPEYSIEFNDFERVAAFILKSTHEDRSRIPAIIPVRVDMIVMATLLTKYILNLHTFKKLKLSAYSLKEGLLFEWIRNQR